MKRWIKALAFLALTGINAVATEAEWEYLDNGTVRIGIDKSRGAGIGFFGESKTGRNLLNHFDEGRFVQQSYYGAKDGSFWNKKPWVYNPVQGGSWDGKKAETLTFAKKENALYARIEPRNWSGGQRCPEAIMEQTLTLDGAVAKISFKMTFTGENQGVSRHQEMPAMFVDAALSNLVCRSEGELTRRVPGWPNESGHTSEYWTAWLNDEDWGVGILTPGTDKFTCYRYHGAGGVGDKAEACSYIAPVRTFELTKGLAVEYDVYLTVGTLEEIQKQFSELKHGNG